MRERLNGFATQSNAKKKRRDPGHVAGDGLPLGTNVLLFRLSAKRGIVDHEKFLEPLAFWPPRSLLEVARAFTGMREVLVRRRHARGAG